MKKILIIEDEQELREELEDILRYEGFKIFSAETGKTGLKIAKKEFPSLILCDIMMPEMSGFEVLQSFRKFQPYITVPFIFITALTDRQNYRKGMDTGADDYLTKPFSRAELLNAVRSRLKKYDQIENQIRIVAEKMESDLYNQVNELQAEIKTEKKTTLELSSQNKNIEKKLKEKELELMNEMMRVVITKNTLTSLDKIIEHELEDNDLSTKSRHSLLKLRRKLRDKPISEKNWAVFQVKVNQVYPGFITKLSNIQPLLTQYDLLITSALKMGMNTKQIGDLLSIADQSVRKSRYRIKQKLGLAKEDNLINYLHTVYDTEDTDLPE